MSKYQNINFELQYLIVLQDILDNGHYRKGRNGNTLSLPFPDLTIDMTHGYFPIITSRKMYLKGILGEWAALIRNPNHLHDFEMWGCNYWKKWADGNGNLELDYGNALFNYNGVDQMQDIVDKLMLDPYDRRMMATQWRPDRLDKLSLPCCWHTLQFWTDEELLHMSWDQRSADWCVGVPSDMVLAATILLCMSSVTGLKPGRIKMRFGDAHVYQEHVKNAKKMLKRGTCPHPDYEFNQQTSMRSFVPSDLKLLGYTSAGPLEFELKA